MRWKLTPKITKKKKKNLFFGLGISKALKARREKEPSREKRKSVRTMGLRKKYKRLRENRLLQARQAQRTF